MRLRTYYLVCLLACFANTRAQETLFRSEEIPVFHDGLALSNPWAGGFNSVQVSTSDFNQDGKRDIFLFDRISRRKMVFLNTGEEPGDILYDHHFEYTPQFPTDLRNWCFLRDFNCDGREDILTNNTSGTKVYENTSEGDEISYTLRTALVESSYDFSGTPFNAPVYTIGPDLPSFVDIEDDGDLDIITFTELSTTLYLYRSLANDIGNCDSLIYTCGNRCYGMLNESSESAAIAIGDEFQCDFNVLDPYRHETGPMRHTGGTLLSLDLDQNGIKDLVVGDVTETYLTAILMQPSEDNLDSAITVDTTFPAQYTDALPLNMEIFPGSFYEDVNGDGIKDLMVSPNAYAETEDRKSLWLYLNEGENDLPDFSFVQPDFLQNTMIDLGLNAYPVVFDENNDGLPDLLLSNNKYFTSTEELTSRFWLYRNVGTLTAPALELADTNYLDVPSLGWTSPYATFGDLDDDGDMDLITGEQTGFVHFWRNTANAGEAADFTLEINQMTDSADQPIDVGQNSTPQLFDLSGDGLLDLVIGEKNGNINYYRNDGDANQWSFTFIEDTIGNVVATNYLGINGYSVPHFYEDIEGAKHLLLGTETGLINHYTDIENNELSDYELVTSSFHDINEGDYSAVFLYDFDHDLKLDMFLGQVGGGVSFYAGDISIQIEELAENDDAITIYPNPAADQFMICYTGTDTPAWKLVDTTGRLVLKGKCAGKETMVNTSGLQSGLYLLVSENLEIRPVRVVIR